MKRRKILVLIPMLGLFLTGCSFQEGFATAKHWIGQNIYHPLKDWIDEMTGKKKEEKKEDEKKEDEGGEVVVTGVTVTPSSLNLTTSSQDQTLTATVAPSTASQEVTWSVAQEGEVITVSDAGVLHVVGAGDAVVTATSKADTTKKGTCTVKVAAPGPSGAIVEPGTYYITATEDETKYYLKANGTSNPLATTNQVEATQFDFVLVEGKTDEYNIKSGEDFLYCINDNSGVKLGTPSEGSQTVWKIATGSREGGGFDMSATTGETERFLSLYNKYDFRAYNSATHANRKVNTDVQVPDVMTLDSIAVTTQPTKTEYYAGEDFDPTGMVVTATYKVEGKEDASAAVTGYTLSKTSFTEDDKGKEITITVTYKDKETTFKVSVSADDKPVDTNWSFTFAKKEFSQQGTVNLGGHEWTLAGVRSAGDSDSFNYDSSQYDKGQQMGSSTKPFSSVTLTCSDFTQSIESVVVETAGASGIEGTVAVSVGGTAFGSAQALSMEKTSKTFEGTASTGAIVITWTQTSSKALYVKSITVNYAK